MWTDSAVGTIDARSTHSRTALLAAATLSLILAWPALTGPFVYEDTHYTQQPLTWTLTPRALLTWTLAGASPFPAHLGNLLLHLACVGVFYVLAVAWMRPLIAFAMTLVFLFHPLTSEAVYYVSGRGDLIAGLGVLGALACYTYGETTWKTVAGITACGLCAMAAKDASALCLIAVIPLCAWLSPVAPARSPLTSWLPPMVWVALGIFVLSLPLRLASWPWVCEQTGQAWHLIRLMVVPVGQSIEAPILPDWQGPIGIIAAVGLFLTALSDWKRAPMALFGVSFLIAAFLPRILIDQLTPFPEPMHEHHAYVPLIGFLLSVGGLV